MSPRIKREKRVEPGIAEQFSDLRSRIAECFVAAEALEKAVKTDRGRDLVLADLFREADTIVSNLESCLDTGTSYAAYLETESRSSSTIAELVPPVSAVTRSRSKD